MKQITIKSHSQKFLSTLVNITVEHLDGELQNIETKREDDLYIVTISYRL